METYWEEVQDFCELLKYEMMNHLKDFENVKRRKDQPVLFFKAKADASVVYKYSTTSLLTTQQRSNILR